MIELPIGVVILMVFWLIVSLLAWLIAIKLKSETEALYEQSKKLYKESWDLHKKARDLVQARKDL